MQIFGSQTKGIEDLKCHDFALVKKSNDIYCCNNDNIAYIAVGNKKRRKKVVECFYCMYQTNNCLFISVK